MKKLKKEKINKISARGGCAFGSKNPAVLGRVFDVDRGGVEPQKRADKVAPETLRTRPSCPRAHANSFFIKYKEPACARSLEPRTVSFAATLSVNYIIHPSKTMSMANVNSRLTAKIL